MTKIFPITITLGHRWPVRFSVQQSNGLDALFKSTHQHIFWKCDLHLRNMCFRLSMWPKGHRESQKYEYEKWIPRTNEAIGLIAFSLIQLKIIFDFSARCLVGPGSTWTSSPKLVPTPLIFLGTSPPCTTARFIYGENTWSFGANQTVTKKCLRRRPSHNALRSRERWYLTATW